MYIILLIAFVLGHNIVCPSAPDSKSYVTVIVEGPLDRLSDICDILNKYDVIYEVYA